MMTSHSGGGPLGHIDAQVSEAAAAIRGLEAPAAETADIIDQAFARTGQSLSRSLARAASDGRISLKELMSAVIAAVGQEAGAQASGAPSSAGLGNVLAHMLSAAGHFSGARAEGGPVLQGGAYLVGERGPEVFRPMVAGSIDSGAGAPNVHITLNVAGGATALVRSEAQIASALNRAARMGLRP